MLRGLSCSALNQLARENKLMAILLFATGAIIQQRNSEEPLLEQDAGPALVKGQDNEHGESQAAERSVDV